MIPSTLRSPDDPRRWFFPDRPTALAWVGERNQQGIQGSLDVLGEYARTEQEADAALLETLVLVAAIREHWLRASVSLKFSALGYLADPAGAAQRGRTLVERAAEAGVPVEIDMEGAPMVPWTIGQALALRGAGYAVTLAVQAYLQRSAEDLEILIRSGVRVRLVKGAYQGDIRGFARIQARFLELARRLIAARVAWCAGTHDPDLIKELQTLVRPGGDLEFGFLYGLADQTKSDLVAAGYAVSEYVPFGPDGGPYHQRRLAYLQALAEAGRAPAP